MRFLAILCAQYLFLIVAVLGLYAYHQAQPSDRRVIFLRGLIVLLLGVLLAKGAGALWSDPRPFVRLHVPPLIAHAPDNGFPSDHTLVSFGIAFLIFPFSRKLGTLAITLAAAVAWARVFTLLHSPTDIYASIVIALATNAVGLIIRRGRTGEVG